jgi:hypothetical protein
MKVKPKIPKVKLFDADEDDEVEEPKVVFKVKPKALTFKIKPKVKVKQSFFRRVYNHGKFIELDELYDEEIYHFHLSRPTTGFDVRSYPGYRLKANWKQLKNAHENPLRGKLKEHFRELDSNWIEVLLPNGKAMIIQPKSKTPSYWK